MKNLLSIALSFLAGSAIAQTTINSATSNSSAYGANIGWINFRGDGANGVSVGDFVCSGFAYSANVGWIHLGDGTPSDGIRYSNAGTDFGVNHDGIGNLRGYAYGANIGWISFESVGNPKVNLQTGVLSGSAYGANVGWISLSNMTAVVKTDSLYAGSSSDRDSIPDAWELGFTSNLALLTNNGDADGDGLSDSEEYLADTNPFDANSNLRIVSYNPQFGINSISHGVTFTSKPTRVYRLHLFSDLNSASQPSGLYFPSPSTQTAVNLVNPQVLPATFVGVEALRPLSP